MWTLSADRTTICLTLPPVRLVGLEKPMELFLDFDDKAVDQFLRPFYAIGEVQKPGNYCYVTDMTALTAVAVPGGFTGTLLRPGDALEVRKRYF
jgi:hypothetical protein